MPLPFLIPVALTAIAAKTAKKVYDGYQDNSRAEELVDRAKRDYRNAKEKVEDSQHTLNSTLNKLSKQQIFISDRLKTFEKMLKDLSSKLDTNNHKKFQIDIPHYKLKQIEEFSVSMSLLGKAAIGMVTAKTVALGGFATPFTLPLVTIGAWSYASNAEKNLDKAREARDEVEEIIKKCDNIVSKLNNTKLYIDNIYIAIHDMNQHFERYYDYIKHVYDLLFVEKISDTEIRRISEDIKLMVNNGLGVAMCMVDTMTTPLFKMKDNNEALVDSDNIPIVNGEVINRVINDKKNLLNKYI